MGKVFLFVIILLIIPIRVLAVSSTLGFINQVRIAHHLVPLVWNNALQRSALDKACDLFNRHYWSHQTPDGRMPWYLFIKDGYRYIYAGENMARGYATNQDAFNAWMKSPSHLANILNPHYRDFGEGACGNILVDHFGSR